MLLIPAHAKVNLCLAVRGRRPDGFHEIDSIVVRIDWHDLVGIRVRPAVVTAVRLSVAGDTAGLPPHADNLAVRAGRAVASATGPLDMALWLDKRVPSEAGLGGGSADAAAVLRGCASLLRDAELSETALLGLAASLGSDVPVMTRRGTQRVRGRGEDLATLSAPTLHMVVAVLGASSTAATYAALEAVDFEDAARSVAVADALPAGRIPDDDLLGSGLEPAACRANAGLRERLQALRAAMTEARWHLTGSGAAAFAVLDSADAAAALANRATGAGFPSRACRTISG
jgi:4-diphosphocytidyl-2-C-methyl-D-erythritol kinase